MSGIFKRGYEVTSGPWPFYRICILFIFVGSLTQPFVAGVPASVSKGFPFWLGTILNCFFIVGCGAILIAIVFLRQDIFALSLERFGTHLSSGAAYLYYANFFLTAGIPTTNQTWMMMALMVYGPIRIRQLGDELSEARLKIDEHLGKGSVAE